MGEGAKLGIAVAGVAAVVALCLIGWIGGEMHYRNCLHSVELRFPVAYQPGQANQYSDPHAHFAFYDKVERDHALSSCSRWP